MSLLSTAAIYDLINVNHIYLWPCYVHFPRYFNGLRYMVPSACAHTTAMASLKTGAGHYKYSTISKLMKTYLLKIAKQQCGFWACVLDGEQNLHRASCGFGARHGRRRSVCEGEFACGSAAIRTFQEWRQSKIRHDGIQSSAFAPCMMSRVRLLNHLWTNLSITVYINLANVNMCVS